MSGSLSKPRSHRCSTAVLRHSRSFSEHFPHHPAATRVLLGYSIRFIAAFGRYQLSLEHEKPPKGNNIAHISAFDFSMVYHFTKILLHYCHISVPLFLSSCGAGWLFCLVLFHCSLSPALFHPALSFHIFVFVLL